MGRQGVAGHILGLGCEQQEYSKEKCLQPNLRWPKKCGNSGRRREYLMKSKGSMQQNMAEGVWRKQRLHNSRPLGAGPLHGSSTLMLKGTPYSQCPSDFSFLRPRLNLLNQARF